MTLRIKILGFISTMIIAMIIILYACIKIIVLSNSSDIELQIATNNALRISNFISYELERITNVNQNLSEWDESIDFVNGNVPNYEENNLAESAYISMQLESIIFLDIKGDIIYKGFYNLSDESISNNSNIFNNDMELFINKNKDIWLKLEAKESISGIENIDNKIFLYSIKPIVNSKGTGESHGVIITGKFFGEDEIAIINNILKTEIEVTPIKNSVSILAEEKKYSNKLDISENDIEIKQLSAERQSASFIIKNNEDIPIAKITSYVDRSVYSYGQNNLHYFLFTIIFICIVVCIAILWLLDKNVLSKIQKIIIKVDEIEKTGNLSLRINNGESDCTDELCKLSVSIDNMLETLETSKDNLEYLSMHDPLTGLYNRAKFEQGMEAIKHNNIVCITIMICDVDGLKQVNDNKGHKEGDVLLIAVANILKKCFRDKDKLYRIGGDEFSAILEVNNMDFMNNLYERINSSIDEYNKNNPELPISISIGFACNNKVYCDADSLFKEADNNMYIEKIEHHKKKS